MEMYEELFGKMVDDINCYLCFGVLPKFYSRTKKFFFQRDMKIFVKVKPRAKIEKVERVDNSQQKIIEII